MSLYEAEAEACLAAGLVLPAHDYILKCSHTFNVLDARGAVGVTERAGLLRPHARLSRRVAEAYLAQRQAAGVPVAGRRPHGCRRPAGCAGPPPRCRSAPPAHLPARDRHRGAARPATWIGALEQLRQRVPACWTSCAWTTARARAGHAAPAGRARRGPGPAPAATASRWSRARRPTGPSTPQGKPTAGRRGLRPQQRAWPSRRCRCARWTAGGMSWPRCSQSGPPGARGAGRGAAGPGRRPEVREVHALERSRRRPSRARSAGWWRCMGDQVVPFAYAGLQSGGTTRGLRFDARRKRSPSRRRRPTSTCLVRQGIVLDPRQRRGAIAAQVQRRWPPGWRRSPIEDVACWTRSTNLVERPTALLGTFDRQYLALPREVLIAVMKKHQRYFPVPTKGGQAAAATSSPCATGTRWAWTWCARATSRSCAPASPTPPSSSREDLQARWRTFCRAWRTLTFQEQARLDARQGRAHRACWWPSWPRASA